MAYDPTRIPDENLSNILPDRMPKTVKAYYDGSQSMIFTNSVASSASFTVFNPSTGTQDDVTRLDFFDLNNEKLSTFNKEKVLSWCDLYSWPKEGIRIQPPSLKENYVDLPGGNGSLDFAEALTGYPLYQNRSGSINWEVDPYRDGNTIDYLFQRIDSFLHGRKMYALCVEDVKYIEDAYGDMRPNVNYEPWYYEGRFTISSESLGQSSPSWTLNYNLSPYKKLLWTTADDFVWDCFDFENGIDYQSIFKDRTVSGTDDQHIGSWIGTMPTIPTIKVTATTTQNQCRALVDLPALEGSEGSTLGLIFRVKDLSGRTTNPQDSGYIFVANNTDGIKEPRLTMAGSGIRSYIDEFTGEEIADNSIILYAYGTGTYTIDMQIGVI